LFASFAQAATYTARVVAITDGDTLRALHEGRAVVVRLRWIDAPENGQAGPGGARRWTDRGRIRGRRARPRGLAAARPVRGGHRAPDGHPRGPSGGAGPDVDLALKPSRPG